MQPCDGEELWAGQPSPDLYFLLYNDHQKLYCAENTIDSLAAKAPTACCGVTLATRDWLPECFNIGSWILVLGNFDAVFGCVFAVIVQELKYDNVLEHPILICCVFQSISNRRGSISHVRTATLPSTLCCLFLTTLCTLILA